MALANTHSGLVICQPSVYGPQCINQRLSTSLNVAMRQF
jgi:hypothetical protein